MDGLSPFAVWVGAGSLVVSAMSLVVTAAQAVHNARWQRLSHELETFRTLSHRYNEWARGRKALCDRSEPPSEAEVHNLYNAYWAICVDQWEAYKRSVISEGTYVSWLVGMLDTMRGRHDLPPDWTKRGRNITRNVPDLRLLCERIYELSSQHGREDLSPDQLARVRRTIRRALSEARRGPDAALHALGRLKLRGISR